MRSFVKLNIGESEILINLQKIISIEMTESSAVIHCEDGWGYNIDFDQNMTETKFMNSIGNITNIYIINE